MNATTSPAAAADGRLFFTAGDGSPTGRELYASDGTAAGTSLFKDIYTFPFAGSSPDSLTNLSGVIYFSATGSGDQGNELWKTDGTPAGTVIVKDVGSFSGQGVLPKSLIALGSTLYYVGDDGQFFGVSALWKSDGTDQGTVIVPNVSSSFTLPSRFVVKGPSLFF